MISINGKIFKDDIFKGNNITVTDTEIIIDGKKVMSDVSGVIKVIIDGDLKNLNCTNCEINGDIKGDVDATRVRCHDIGGNVDATNVKCHDIKGNIDATVINKN